MSISSEWPTTLGLIFGGCCSNAVTLEQVTSQYPNAGTLITFFQFLVISLYGLPKQLVFDGFLPRLRPRAIPLTPYFAQVFLFYITSLLNNAAFGYDIPMPVHIIFRSGGLVVTMFLGFAIANRRYLFALLYGSDVRYTLPQVLSVLAVTAGVVITTLSSASPQTSNGPVSSYLTGIGLLSIALVLSGFLGLVQDWTWKTYGRPKASSDGPPAWQESLFYLHFLSLPMFWFVRNDLKHQFASINAGPQYCFHPSLCVPEAYIPLFINTITQLFCAAGVHRLYSRVSALTVTLTLVVRKAVSMIISVLWLQAGNKTRDSRMLWTGALLVLQGTIAYSYSSRKPVEKPKAH